MRWLSGLAAIGGWLFCWSQLRGIRAEYIAGGLGPIPLWLLVLLGAVSTLLLATAVAIVMNLGPWPKMSVAVGLAFVAVIYLSHWSLLTDTVRRFDAENGSGGARRGSSVATDSLEAMLKVAPSGEPRSLATVAIFIAGVPTALVLSGLTVLIRPSRDPSEAAVA